MVLSILTFLINCFNRDTGEEEMDGHARSRRKALKVAVGALCTEVGYGMAEESCLETLTEMLQSSTYFEQIHIHKRHYLSLLD